MYQYKPSDTTHIVPSENETTLCGMSHDGDLRDVGEDPDSVLSKTQKNCKRCRASYVKQVLNELDVDVTNLSEGDVIEFWEHEDPTKASSFTLRGTGEITRTPPFTQTIGGEEYEITDRYKVHKGGNTYTQVQFSRIWRVDDGVSVD